MKQRIQATLYQFMVYGYLEGGKPYSSMVAVIAMTEEIARKYLEEEYPNMTHDVAVEMDDGGEYVWDDDLEKYVYENGNVRFENIQEEDDEEEEDDGEW